MMTAQSWVAVSRGIALTVFALAPACCFPSAPPFQAQNETPWFRVTSRLVDLTVVAIDKNGNPVADLNQEDFAVFDNGKSRNISFFRYEGAPDARPAKAPTLTPFVFTNRAELDPSRERNITALVLDAVNTEARDQIFVKGQTVRLLRALAPHTRVAIYRMGREFQVIHDFSDDMASLRARLEELSAEFPAQRLNDVEADSRQADALLDQIEARKTPYAGPVFRAVQAMNSAALAGEINSNASIRGNRTLSTLAALETLGRHLSGVPGRKSVVWISGGISLLSPRVSTTPNSMPVNPTAGDNLEKVIRKTSERLAQFGVALYAVDARGLRTSAESLILLEDIPLLPGRYSEMERAAGENADSRAAFSLMTSITGGRFIFGTNDFSEGVRKVSGDLQGSYSLGFYALEEPDGKWHTLKLTVRRPDVRLLHKEGYRPDISPAKPQTWNREAERRAMMNPLGFDAIGLSARCAPAEGSDPGTLLLTLQIAAEDLLWHEESGRMVGGAEVYICEKTAAGEVRFQQSRINARFLPQQMEAARSQGLPFRRQWKPGADTLTIRVLARDPATGQLGTVDIPMPRAGGNNK